MVGMVRVDEEEAVKAPAPAAVEPGGAPTEGHPDGKKGRTRRGGRGRGTKKSAGPASPVAVKSDAKPATAQGASAAPKKRSRSRSKSRG